MRSWRAGLLALVVLGGAVTLISPAVARTARRCHPAVRRGLPVVIAPCSGASTPVGTRVTFTVRDTDPSAYRIHPTLYLTRRPPRHGRLKVTASPYGVFQGMKPVRHHRGLFRLTPLKLTYPGYWELTPGRYYIQVQQIEDPCHVLHCTRYGPISTIVIR